MLYLKKYLFLFLNKTYNNTPTKTFIAILFLLTLISLLWSPAFVLKAEHTPFKTSLLIFAVLVLFSSVLMVLMGTGKNKIDLINKNIEEKLEILKNKKLLESKIKNSKNKDSNKKYL